MHDDHDGHGRDHGRDNHDHRAEGPGTVSRRDLLKHLGAAAGASAAAAASVTATPALAVDPPMAGMSHGASDPALPEALQAFETLNGVEADALRAMVARIIPTDENGPGATEAHAAHYIDRALAGPLAANRAAYANGLAALDDWAVSSKGKSFSALSAKDQDAVLTDLEKNVATGFVPNAAAFFNLVRTHTIQGTFCDPYYGGNADYVGWDLIGYPGLRMGVTAADQKMAKPTAVRVSAYADDLYTMRGMSYGR